MVEVPANNQIDTTPGSPSENLTGSSSNDEELRKLLKPKVSKEQAKEILIEHYASNDTSEASVEVHSELDSYDDVNFMVSINQIKYLLKIHNGVESRDYINTLQSERQSNDPDSSVIHLQSALFRCLNTDSVTAPQSIHPSTDKTAVLVLHSLPVLDEKHSPRSLVVRLLSWVDGRPMSTIPFLAVESIAHAGRYLAEIHSTLSHANFTPGEKKAAQRYHQWDGKNTADLAPFVQFIDDENRRKMIESILDTFRDRILNAGAHKAFPIGIIHGDFNDANILVDENGRILGVIDFGDSVESWRILDVTVAMAYAMLTTYGKSGRMLSAAASFLRGYCSQISLLKEEKEHIVLLTACRLACSVTLGNYTYKQNPENEYILLHSRPAWNALELLWGYDASTRQEKHETFQRFFAVASSDNFPSQSSSDSVFLNDLVFPDPEAMDLLAPLRRVDGSLLKHKKNLE